MKYLPAFSALLLMANACFSAEIDFNREIRPILSDKCFHCHGPDESTREADFRLDIHDDNLTEYGIVTPGNLEESELWARVVSEDPDVMMPPPESHKPFTNKERQLIKNWIEQGAKWSDHWAYVAPVQVETPEVQNANWAKNPIDHFILSRLEHEGLAPAPQADAVTLLRRVSFDLTGLPPSPELSKWFLESPQARYEELVDRLLAQSAYGERMAIYWLDLVRYADTVGYHGDQVQTVSPYRDWVIDAFNSNMPFDEMTRQQIAGDLLSNPSQQNLIATTYNRLLQTTHEGGLQVKEYRAIYQADRVRNVTAVWMGATVGCAQCHDHKYDPYTTKDFYSMGAFFADIDDEQHFESGTNANPTRREPSLKLPTKEQSKELQQLNNQYNKQREIVHSLKKQLPKTESKQNQDDAKPEADPELAEALKTAEAKLKQLDQKRKRLEEQIRRTLITKTLSTPRETKILPRGNWQDESGDVVQPAVPEFMGNLNLQKRATRLDLANWLTDSEKGSGLLTARVMANRLWYLCFGNGLSSSLEDFGGQGEPPVHPELLDHLAHQLIQYQWDLKKTLRYLVLSSTYRQSSVWREELNTIDPDNRLLARQSSYRLSAEMIRDNALVLSGLLNTQVGGESARPYQPSGYYRHLNFPVRKYRADTDADQYRRGVYVHWQRQFLHPMLKAFDAPSREECTAKRPRSNTPLAALTLMNDPTFLEASHAFAVRAQTTEKQSPQKQVEWVFHEAVNRTPNTKEVALLNQVYSEALQFFQQHPKKVQKRLSVGMFQSDRSASDAKLAALAEVCRVVLNLAETSMRN